MAEDAVRAVINRLFDEFYNGGKPQVALVIMTSDMRLHNMGRTTTGGPEVFMQRQSDQLVAAPDFRMSLDDLLIEGDKAAYRWTMSGTNTGPMFGRPPTGKKFAIQGMSILRVSGGKIAEVWHSYDALGMRRQLGLEPTPEK